MTVTGTVTGRFLISDGSEIQLRGKSVRHGAMGRQIDPSWGGPIELFLVPASTPRLL